MRFEILGPLRVLDDDHELNLGGPRQQAVLAALIAAAPGWLSIHQLIEEVWGEGAPETARHVTRTYLSNLRRALNGRVLSDGRHYRLDIQSDELDSAEFVQMLHMARDAPDAEDRIRILRASESLWRGRPFGDPDGSPNIDALTAELEELLLQSKALRLEAQLRADPLAEAIAELQLLTRLHHLDERFHQLLMLALYRHDRIVESLEVCATLRARLAEEFGVEPSERTMALEDRILRRDPSLLELSASTG